MSPIAKLRAFAQDIIDCHTGCLEGSDIEDIAVRHGLMEMRTVDKECCENCACAEFGFPTQCAFRTPLLRGRGVAA